MTEDDNVKVTATLVSHYDVFPAFAFRFDLKKAASRSPSPATPRSRTTWIELAKDTDYLVHEAEYSLDNAFFSNRFPPGLPGEFTRRPTGRRVARRRRQTGDPEPLRGTGFPAERPTQWIEKIAQHYKARSRSPRDGQVFEI